MFKIKIIYLYIIKEFLRPFLYSILSFVLIFVVVEILQRIRTFYSSQASISDISLFYFYKIPFVIIQILPLAAILATIFSLGNLVKNNEIVALRNSGISILKIVSPILIFAFCLGIFVFLFNESVLPYTNFMADKINNERIRKIVVAENEIQTNMAYRGNKGELLFAERFYISSQVLDDIILFIFNEKNELIQIVNTNKAYWENNKWKMNEGYMRILKNGNITLEKFVKNSYLPLSSSPHDLSWGQRPPTDFSYWELKIYIEKLRISGREYYNYLADLYAKTSVPFSCFIIIILGIPVALKQESRSKSIEFGLSILLAFVFWGTNQIFYSLGKSGIILPILSAWLGNIIFLFTGSFLIYKRR
ncbi:MAG: LptF/LptG family permease [Candidatus Firestonebacteria bacterium]|nr:LptF/LptG family permease [Candidatus Firestonebacteria bacterium]